MAPSAADRDRYETIKGKLVEAAADRISKTIDKLVAELGEHAIKFDMYGEGVGLEFSRAVNANVGRKLRSIGWSQKVEDGEKEIKENEKTSEGQGNVIVIRRDAENQELARRQEEQFRIQIDRIGAKSRNSAEQTSNAVSNLTHKTTANALEPAGSDFPRGNGSAPSSVCRTAEDNRKRKADAMSKDLNAAVRSAKKAADKTQVEALKNLSLAAMSTNMPSSTNNPQGLHGITEKATKANKRDEASKAESAIKSMRRALGSSSLGGRLTKVFERQNFKSSTLAALARIFRNVHLEEGVERINAAMLERLQSPTSHNKKKTPIPIDFQRASANINNPFEAVHLGVQELRCLGLVETDTGLLVDSGF